MKTGDLYSFLATHISKSDIYASKAIATISAAIINYRKENCLTQKEFADYMGVTQGMVSKWESADYNFTVESIAQIADKIELVFDVELKTEREYLRGKAANDYFRNLHSNKKLKNYKLSSFAA